MAQPPASVLRSDWISLCLPTLEQTEIAPKMGSRGSAHKQPRTYLQIPKKLVQLWLARPEVKAALAGSHIEIEQERSHLLHTEADVERAANLYLIHEMNFIFKVILGSLSVQLQEELKCSSQVSQKGTRIDITWYVNDKAIVIMEYKRCHIVERDQWTARTIEFDEWYSMPKELRDTSEFKEKVETKLAELRGRKADSQTHIAKQIGEYAEQRKAPIMIVFDWNEMILVDMYPSMKKHHSQTNPAQIFFSDEGLPDADGDCEFTHRKVLLAAFIRGLEKQKFLEELRLPSAREPQNAAVQGASRVRPPRNTRSTVAAAPNVR
ncbi:hypothetical protein R3P38DRAFT_3261118 [Favolaschia claudopus]|uniref:NERD domain-containing protein n=1 Tax=Favolaschia claudopus TaxID=2862362 RepID=A0AAW0CNB4_9AGAR